MARVYTIVLLIVLLSPLVLKSVFKSVPDYELNGYFATTPKPALSKHTFFDASYQDSLTSYIQENSVFHGYMIALANQIDFSLFRLPHYTIEKGREGQLFFWDHNNCHCGALSLSDDSLMKKTKECVSLKSMLDSMHIPMVFVFAPGKGNYYEDKMPKYYQNNCNTDNDYNRILKLLKANNMEVIDLNSWFKSMRYTAKYPLFPKLGTHWSFYGACLAADSLVKFVEQKLNTDLPYYHQKNIKVTDQIDYANDRDLASLLNLLFPLKSDSLAYPEYEFWEDSTRHHKPKILIVSDSFTWGLLDTHIPPHVFSDESRFWFYKNQLYDFNSRMVCKNPDSVSVLNLLKGTEAVFFLSTERLNHRFDFGFGAAVDAQRTSIDSLMKSK